ncbi:MAG: flagellar hook-length control protein FliK [Hyphomicrobiaceae bacterium]
MKPLAAPLPSTSTHSVNPSRLAKDKTGEDGQEFLDILELHEDLITARVVDGEPAIDSPVLGQNEAEVIEHAGREQDEISQILFPTPVSTELVKNATENSSTSPVELNKPSLHEVETDHLSKDPTSDLAENTAIFVGEVKVPHNSLKVSNDKSNSTLDSPQVDRLTGQTEIEHAIDTTIPRTILKAERVREGEGSISVKQNAQVTINKETSPPDLQSKSNMRDLHHPMVQEDQQRQKSIATIIDQPATAKASPAIGGPRSIVENEKLPSFVTKTTSENILTQVDRVLTTKDFQSVLFDKVERDERVRSVLQPMDSYEVSASSTVVPQKGPSEKPVGSQIVQFLLSNLPEVPAKSTANAIPTFTPGLTSSVVVKSLNLVLQPDNLGTVKIELSLKNQKLTVEIIADNAEAVDKLQASQETINQKMKSDGYVIDQFLIKTSDVTRVDEANRNLEKYSAIENNETEHSGSRENDASNFGGDGKRQDQQNNAPAVERAAETDWRNDDEIYL